MRIIKDIKGFSVLEIICITIILIILALMVIVGICQLKDYLNNGNDSLMVNTASSVASVNMLDNNCVVNDCNGISVCKHANSDGYKTGYYDAITHHIIDTLPSGYNEFSIMKIDDKYYHGSDGTMVIKVIANKDNISLKWVKGELN